MKRYTFLTLIMLTLCPTIIWAKRPFYKNHAFGMTGGATFSSMSFSPVSVQQKMNIGKTFGLSYRYIEERYFGVQIELLYTDRGWSDELKNFPSFNNYSRTLSYIELPILSHIHFGNQRVRGFVNLGPKFGYFLNEKVETNINEPLPGYDTEHQTLPISKKLDYGITGGAGIELKFGKNAFAIEGRYYFGLGDIFPNEKGNTFETSSNQHISVAATYFFYLRR